MAKRFTDTGKWSKEWFRKLPVKMKCVWEYLRDNCDHAGVWAGDFELMTFQVGERVTPEECVAHFGAKRFVTLEGGKFFLPTFVEFQYGELNPDNRAHLSVISILKKEGAYKGLGRPSQGRKDKDKEQDKEKGGVGENKTLHPLAEIWNENRGTLPKVLGCEGKRLTAAQARWNDRPDPEHWKTVIARMTQSPFCRGEKNQPGPHENWKADFDWLIQSGVATKVLEGKYDDRPGVTTINTKPMRPEDLAV